MKRIEISYHTRSRMNERSIDENQITEAVKSGIRSKGKTHATQVVEYKDLVVVISERDDKIIIVTCKYNRKYTNLASKLGKKTGIGFHKALEMMKQKNIQVS